MWWRRQRLLGSLSGLTGRGKFEVRKGEGQRVGHMPQNNRTDMDFWEMMVRLAWQGRTKNWGSEALMAHLDAKTTEKASRGWSLGLLPSAVPGAYIPDFLEVPPQIPFMGSLLLKGNSPGRGSRKKRGARRTSLGNRDTSHP